MHTISPATEASKHDDVLEALDGLVEVLRENALRSARAVERAETIRALRRQGRSYSDIALTAERPLIVEIATTNLEALARTGSRLRRAEAKALHREGMTMDRIADLFGVTRQRVSALIASRQPASTALATRSVPNAVRIAR